MNSQPTLRESVMSRRTGPPEGSPLASFSNQGGIALESDPEEARLGTTSARKHGALALRVEQDRDTLTLRAAGELDIDSAALVEQSLLRAFEGGAGSIVLDLTAVSFIDAAGLRLLMWAAECSREDSGRLRMECGSAAVHHLLDVAQLGR